ncbi:MAG: MarR family transcriptional regulator [Thermodesulfobacteriota bacterium]|nr:MarR family transcriptional regulator [Thermodesulfobacteriota bacterium]
MLEQTDLQIIMRLRQIIQEMSRHSKHLQEKYKITIPQLICLREIFQHGPISLSALTKIVFLNNSTVTGIVDRLENRGFVQRTRISKDRRQVHAEITQTGIDFIENSPPPLRKTFFNRLAELEEEKITLILWSLEMIVDMLGPEKELMKVPVPPAHFDGPEDEITPSNEI